MSADHGYAVVFEKTNTGFSAYAPDLPGCIATGPTLPEVEQLMREGIAIYVEELQQMGEPVPPPTTLTAYVAFPPQLARAS